MIATGMKATGWLIVVLAAVAIYVSFFMLGHSVESRGWWIEMGVLIGFVLLGLLVIQFVTTGRFRHVGIPFGTDSVIWFHRQLGTMLLIVLLAHPVILIVSKPEYLEFFDPRVNALRAVFLVLASLAMLLLVVLSLWRKSFGLSYEMWRLSHAIMAAGVVFIGCVHAWQVGHYVDGFLKRTGLVLTAVIALGLLIKVRLWRPWIMQRNPYRVTEVREERGDSTTLVLRPEGHGGMTFLGGQYAWFTMGDSPFSLQQHPFSFSSSDQASPDSLEITAKELGDFTSSFQKVDVGTKVYVEGPFGRFTLEEDASGAVFIMGGIGITPAISILRSMRDRGDRRPCLLIYGNSNWHEAAFRKELEKLQRELNLRVVYVLDEPPSDWAGETGYIDSDLLKRHIDETQRQYAFFICGPIPLMDVVEPAIRQMGVPQSRIRAERFTMV